MSIIHLVRTDTGSPKRGGQPSVLKTLEFSAEDDDLLKQVSATDLEQTMGRHSPLDLRLERNHGSSFGSATSYSSAIGRDKADKSQKKLLSLKIDTATKKGDYYNDFTSDEDTEDDFDCSPSPPSSPRVPRSPHVSSHSIPWTPRTSRKVQQQYSRDTPWVELVKSLPGNDRCVDCGASKPEWCLVYFGGLVCLECASEHRSLGVATSRVLHLTMDSFAAGEYISRMSENGNARLSEYFDSLNVPKNLSIRIKYSSPQAQAYRMKLLAMADGMPTSAYRSVASYTPPASSQHWLWNKLLSLRAQRPAAAVRIGNPNNANLNGLRFDSQYSGRKGCFKKVILRVVECYEAIFRRCTILYNEYSRTMNPVYSVDV
eukprot:g2216.t1